jgi:cytochrome c-type biogenesis protein CcmH/NrfF
MKLNKNKLKDAYVLLLVLLVIGLDISAYFVSQNPNLHPDKVLLWGTCSVLTVLIAIIVIYHFKSLGD